MLHLATHAAEVRGLLRDDPGRRSPGRTSPPWWRADPSRPSPRGARSARRSLIFGHLGLPGEHLHERLVMRESRGIHAAELLENRVPLANERSSVVELTPHGVEHRERVECLGDRNRAASNLLADVEAQLDRLVHGRRAENSCRSAPVQDLEQLPLSHPRARVFRTAPPCLVRICCMAEGPCTECFEDQARHLPTSSLRSSNTAKQASATRCTRRSRQVRLQADELLLDACAGVEELVTRRSLDCLGEDTVSFRQLACFEERGPERGQQGKAGRGHPAGGVRRRVRGGCRRLPGLRARRPCVRPPRAAPLLRTASFRSRSPTSPSSARQRYDCSRWKPTISSSSSEFASSRLARRSCRSPRTSFGTPSYAASWISTCVNLNASSAE